MRIGIDIDGVLTDLEQWQLDYATKFYYEKLNKQITNPKAYEASDMFGGNLDLDNEFWAEYFKEYCLNVEVRKFAREVIQKLKDDGNEIYIITARSGYMYNSEYILTNEESYKIVREWLSKNKIYYDKIIFSPEEKLEICQQNNIDIMIEDKPANINSISNIIPVICFNAGYNENCRGNNIIRAYSWYDIYLKIHKRV